MPWAYVKYGKKRPTLGTSAGGSPPVVSFAVPKSFGADYRSNSTDFGGAGNIFGSAALTLHKKYKYNLLNMQPSQATPGGVGYNFVQALIADDPTREIFQYSIASQQYDANYAAPTYSPVYDLINAGGTSGGSWWAKDKATGRRTRTPTALSYQQYEVNLCKGGYTTPNASGLYAAECIADGLKSMIFTNLVAAGAKGAFQDNVWGCPGGYVTAGTFTQSFSGSGADIGTGTNLSSGALTCGEYNVTGGAGNATLFRSDWSTRTSAPQPQWRQGLADYANRMRSGFTGFKMIANADADFKNDATWGNSCLGNTELTGVYDYGFIEALTANISNDSPTAQIRGLYGDMLNRVYTQHDNCISGAIVSCYVISGVDNISRTLQKARFCLGTALLADAWVCVSDRIVNSVMRPWWFQELAAQVGVPSGARPTADNVGSAGFNGMYKRDYTNAMVVVNPSSNKGRWMASAGGTFTIVRASNSVTLTWSAMPAALVAAVTTGVTRIRIMDCATNSTFNGVWTITGKSATTLTWAQTAANASVDHPLGYFGIQSSVDLSGQGLRRFSSTDDTPSVTGYDGTGYVGTNQNWLPSQNDGSVVTTLNLWPNDAILLMKS